MGCDGAGNKLVGTTVRNYRFPITPADTWPGYG